MVIEKRKESKSFHLGKMFSLKDYFLIDPANCNEYQKSHDNAQWLASEIRSSP